MLKKVKIVAGYKINNNFYENEIDLLYALIKESIQEANKCIDDFIQTLNIEYIYSAIKLLNEAKDYAKITEKLNKK